MSSTLHVLKSVGPKLVPFLKTVAVYFVLLIPTDSPSLWAMFVKCAPVLSLIFFVLLHGMSFGDEYAFSRRILVGLIFSCLGDALIIWPQHFVTGMAAFGVAQVAYMSAFQFQPLRPLLGAVVYGLCTLAIVKLLPGTNGLLVFGLPIYTVLLGTMVWRAIARVRFRNNLWTWTEMCSCLGGIFFTMSDTLIGFHSFHHPIAYSQILIMVTYYLAQVGIALSVVDSKSCYELAQEKLKQKELMLERNSMKNHPDFGDSSSVNTCLGQSLKVTPFSKAVKECDVTTTKSEVTFTKCSQIDYDSQKCKTD